MSTVFLPFIKESSSELAVFKAIVQRTKGSTLSTISDLYAIILTLGITEARKKVDSYPAEFTTSAKIKELINEHPQYHIVKNEQTFWACAVVHEEQNTNSDYLQYTPVEREIFFTVVAILKAK